MLFPDQIADAPDDAGVYLLRDSGGTVNHIHHAGNIQRALREIWSRAADPRKGATTFEFEIIPDPKARASRAQVLIERYKPTTQTI